MPSLRSIAPNTPNSPLTRQASASRTIRSFSAALNTRRERFATVSSGAADEATGSGRARGGGIANKAGFRDGWGMFVNPFFAHSYINFEKELSHATLAQRAGLRSGSHPTATPERYTAYAHAARACECTCRPTCVSSPPPFWESLRRVRPRIPRSTSSRCPVRGMGARPRQDLRRVFARSTRRR